MAQSYHPDTPQTIPIADLIHSEQQLNPDVSSYPDYFQRDEWVTARITQFSLTVGEGAVLRRIAHYAGTKAGCWAGIDRIAADIGSHEKTVRRALKALVQHGLIEEEGRKDRTKILTLCFDSGQNARFTVDETGHFVPETGHSARSEENSQGQNARFAAGDTGHSVPNTGHNARLHENSERQNARFDSDETGHFIPQSGHGARIEHDETGHSVSETGHHARLTVITKEQRREDEYISSSSSSDPQVKADKMSGAQDPVVGGIGAGGRAPPSASEQAPPGGDAVAFEIDWNRLPPAYSGALIEYALREYARYHTWRSVGSAKGFYRRAWVKFLEDLRDWETARLRSLAEGTDERAGSFSAGGRGVLTDEEFAALPKCPDCNHWHLSEADRDICNDCRWNPGWFRSESHQVIPGYCPEDCPASLRAAESSGFGDFEDSVAGGASEETAGYDRY